MAAIHVSYHFQTTEKRGFGDFVIQNMNHHIGSADDVAVLKRRIHDELVKDGTGDAVVVIIGWNRL